MGKHQGVTQNKILIVKIPKQNLLVVLIFLSCLVTRKYLFFVLHQIKLKFSTTENHFVSFNFFSRKYISLKICRDKSLIMSWLLAVILKSVL